MTKEKLTVFLLAILGTDVILTLFVILAPNAFPKVSKIHHSYVVPGPFFDAKRIVNSYSLYISWKSGSQWSAPIAPAKDNFIRYSHQFNPSTLYRSRYERAMYQGIVARQEQTADSLKGSRPFGQLVEYLSARYGPTQRDSVRIWIIRKKATTFELRTDTLFNFDLKAP